MNKEIHPTYYPKATIECACGNKLETGSTKEHLKVGICSACHPFYTGKEKLVDAMGRVERFRKREEMSKQMKDKEGRSKEQVRKAKEKKKNKK